VGSGGGCRALVVAAVTQPLALLLTLGALLLVFALFYVAGTLAMWWAMITREEGDLE